MFQEKHIGKSFLYSLYSGLFIIALIISTGLVMASSNSCLTDTADLRVVRDGVCKAPRTQTIITDDQLPANSETKHLYHVSSGEIIVGDWNGDGTEDFGIIRADITLFYNESFGVSVEKAFVQPNATSSGVDEYFVGDWDGDGADELGFRRDKTLTLLSGFDVNDVYKTHIYQSDHDEYFVGDWDVEDEDDENRNRDSFAVRDGNRLIIDIDFDNSNNETVTGTDADCDETRNRRICYYGRSNGTDKYLVGDWDGDGDDDFGVRREGNQLILDADFNPNNNGSGSCGDGNNRQICYYGLGNSETSYLVGNWDGKDGDDLGIVRQGLVDPDNY